MSLLSHNRYLYDSLILSKQAWAYPRQHLQKLLWCVVSVRLNLPEVEERKLCPLRYYANCVSTTLTVLIVRNVESVHFFIVTLCIPWENTCLSGIFGLNVAEQQLRGRNFDSGFRSSLKHLYHNNGCLYVFSNVATVKI